MPYDYHPLNRALSTLDECVENVTEMTSAAYSDDHVLSVYDDLRSAVKNVRAAILDAVNHFEAPEPTPDYRQDIKTVTVWPDRTYALAKLARHILYCIDDKRVPSTKYGKLDIEDALKQLSDLNLIVADENAAIDWELSDSGVVVCQKLRERNG